jgi:hypothetical protein
VFCTCGKQGKAGYTAMPDENGGPHDRHYDYWVCANCLLPSRLIFEGITMSLAPARATRLVAYIGHTDGTATLRWATEISGERIETMTYLPYPRTGDNKMDQGRSHLVTLWNRLDGYIDDIRGNYSPDLSEYNKACATTLASTLALLMGAYYPDTNAVLAESMTRWEARQKGRMHESPGLAEHHWAPAPPADAPPRRTAQPATPKQPAAKLTDQQVTFIKHSISNSIQTPAVLASMFGVTEADVKAAFDS